MLGCLANELANAQPQRAHAVRKLQRTGAYVISVRAPFASPSGADALCGQFGGGGRARAAGIDGLPAENLERSLAIFANTRWGEQALMRPYDGDDDGGSGRRTHR